MWNAGGIAILAGMTGMMKPSRRDDLILVTGPKDQPNKSVKALKYKLGGKLHNSEVVKSVWK
jgi:hypothetical protein